MSITFKDAIMYVIGTIQKIPNLLEGLKYYPNGFQGSIEKLQAEGTYIDISETENNLYSAMGSMMWISLFVSIITLLVSNLVIGLDTLVGGIYLVSSLIGTVVAMGLSLCIVSGIVYIGKKYSTKWNLMVVKVIIVLFFLNIIFTVFGLIGNFGGLFLVGKLSVYKIVNTLLSVFSSAVTLLGAGVVLTSVNNGVILKDNHVVSNVLINKDVSDEETNEETDEKIEGNTEEINCPNCNEIVSDNVRFCPNCGSHII